MQRLQRLIFEISFEIKSFVNRYITIAFTILFHCLNCSHLYEPNGAAQQFNNKNSKKISTTTATNLVVKQDSTIPNTHANDDIATTTVAKKK